MIRDNKFLKQEINEGLDLYAESKQLRLAEGFKTLEQFVSDTSPQDLRELYSWYENAMRRRGREPLDEDSFSSHFFSMPATDGMVYGNKETGYLLGYERSGVFIPSHFAPKTLRQGYQLLKRLGQSGKDAVLFITEDLADTLSKMPEWKIEDMQLPAEFRGEVVMKRIAHNHIKDFQSKVEKFLGQHA